MNQAIPSIKEQISDCRDLLNVFQKERRYFMAKDSLAAEEIIPILKLKQRLIGTFEQHKNLELQPEPEAAEGFNEEAEEQRELLSELGYLLEQLLVIDRENEMIMKRLLGRSADKKQNAPGSLVKQAVSNRKESDEKVVRPVSWERISTAGREARSREKTPTIRPFCPPRIEMPTR